MFLQSIGRVTRELESEAAKKELEREVFRKTLLSLKDYEKYENLLTGYEYGSLNQNEIKELKGRINKRNLLMNYFTLDDKIKLQKYLMDVKDEGEDADDDS